MISWCEHPVCAPTPTRQETNRRELSVGTDGPDTSLSWSNEARGVLRQITVHHLRSTQACRLHVPGVTVSVAVYGYGPGKNAFKIYVTPRLISLRFVELNYIVTLSVSIPLCF
jgi:hypothetical protein